MSGSLLPTHSAPLRTPPEFPVASLEFVLEACDPTEALQPDDPRRVDLRASRGGIGIARFERALKLRAPRGGYHHSLLCGHRGSGKSTELLNLKQWADVNGFLTVWEQVEGHFGQGIDLDYSDLFLLAATMTEQAMQNSGHPLPQEKVRNVLQWFKEIIREDSEEYKSEIGAEVGGQLGGKLPLGLGSLFAKMTAGFKGTSAHATRIRDTLRRYPGTLIDLTADLLTTANAILKQQNKPNGLLLLFDGMDRYDPMLIDKVLVRSSEQVRRMACHTVFTFPINLIYSPITGPVKNDYRLCVTLPMLALRRKLDPWADTAAASLFDDHAIGTLRRLLAERLQLDKLFTRPEDVDYLIKMSGGSLRDLIQLSAAAATYTEDEHKITTDAVQEAVRELRGTYMRLMALTPHDYHCLARIAKRESTVTAESDLGPELNRLLFRGCLLEYIQDDQPWYDVHPVLIETEEFRHACASRR